MLIAARNSFMCGGWKNPYVTDGLVAMWDGDWNAGPGKHDANATVWNDLSGNGWDMQVNAGGSFLADRFVSGANYEQTATIINGAIQGDVLTIECLMAYKANIYDTDLIASFDYKKEEYQNGSRCICIRGKNVGFGFIAGGITGYGNVFTHYVGVFNANNVKLSRGYINGVETSNVTAVSIPNTITRQSVGLATATATKGFEIGLIRLYSHALSATEVAANYAVDKARFNPPTST